MSTYTRLSFVVVVALATILSAAAAEDLGPIKQEITKRHDEAVKRLQDWIKLPSIAAENLNSAEGADYMAKLAKEAGFQQATVIQTDGKPGVFATLDAGAKKTVGLYFMYDVKQFDPKEWTSPPLDAALVDKPGLGKVVVGRGAVNQKGPESAFLAALHAIKGANKKMPVNLVMVAEGEEPRIDILGARQTIDTLGILNEKTKGNLTSAEQTLLQQTLFELRMAFLEFTNAITRTPPPGAPAADGKK